MCDMYNETLLDTVNAVCAYYDRYDDQPFHEIIMDWFDDNSSSDGDEIQYDVDALDKFVLTEVKI